MNANIPQKYILIKQLRKEVWIWSCKGIHNIRFAFLMFSAITFFLALLHLLWQKYYIFAVDTE